MQAQKETKDLNKISIFRQPKGFYSVALGEGWERLSYYGALTILVLYLTNNFQFTDNKSYSLYGVFATFCYSMPVVGGFIGDKLLGYRNAVFIGSLFLLAGNLLLAIPNLNALYLGLAFLSAGTGLYKTNCTSLTSTLYSPTDTKREEGFTLYYMGMNIGATLGAVLYSLISQSWGWKYCFIFAAVGIAISSFIFLRFVKIKEIETNIKSFSNKKIFGLKLTYLIYLLLILGCLVLSYLFFFPETLSNVIWPFAIFVIVAIIFSAFKRNVLERNRIIALLILSSFSMCFFIASLQFGSSITLFILRDINRTIFGWKIPTAIFSSLYPLAVIVMAPFVTWLWSKLSQKDKEPFISIKLAAGLFLGALSFICFLTSAYLSQLDSNNHTPLLWIILAYFLLGTGELLMTPALLSAVNHFSPLALRGTMTGIWFFSIAIAGYLSSEVAKLSSHVHPFVYTLASSKISVQLYITLFENLIVGLFSMSILILILTPIVKFMLSEKG